MKTTIYANYGVLAHEKMAVYTVGKNCYGAALTEPIEVNLPTEFDWYEADNELCTVIDGTAYALREILANDYRRGGHDAPALKWFDGQYHTIRLQIAE